MKPRSRRAVVSAALVLAALTVGCGSESSSVPASLAPTGLPDAASPASEFSPLPGSSSAQAVGGGTIADVVSANQTVDAIHGLLTGGALDAASPLGGTIVDATSNPLMVPNAPASASRATSTVACATVKTAARAVATSVQATVAGTQTVRVENGNLRVQEPGGIDLTISGVTVSQDEHGTIDGLTLASDIRVVGTLSDGVQAVDARIQGISGSVACPPHEGASPIVTLTVDSAGVILSGTLGDVRGRVCLTGPSGTLTYPDQVNRFLAARDIIVSVRELSVKDIITSGTASCVISNLQWPSDQALNKPTCSAVYGSAEASFDSKFGLSKEGRVVRVTAEVNQRSPLVFDSAHDDPASGVVQGAFIHRGGRRDSFTVTFQDGRPLVSGKLTNPTGEEERVVTSGDTLKVTGGVRFADGRKTEHEVEVQNVNNGRRITFRVVVRDKNERVVVTITGVVHADKSITGTWLRDGGAVTGSFAINPAGQLRFVNGSDVVVAQATMPAGWNASL